MSEKYIVSARKYRPSTFRSVVGQQSLTHTLKTAIASGRLAHAIDGQRINAPRHGINIVKMADGSTRKVLIK